MLRQTSRIRLAIVPLTLSVAMAACVAYRAIRPGQSDRGILSAHAIHAEQGLDCTDCHSWEERERGIPGHEMCGFCHEIDEGATDKSACNFCHTRDDQSVGPLTKRLSVEIKWDHVYHLAKEIECSTCHSVPDAIPALPRGTLKPLCKDCHSKAEPKVLEDGAVDSAFTRNDCRVCHNELNEEIIPKFLGGVRVPHDMPYVWEKVHGQESKAAPILCAQCHDSQADCEECHRKTPPQNHTLAWRRKTHGLHATWSRSNCAVCHEEDSCLQCHQNTKPTSHRGAFGRPLNSHCVKCHYPPQRSNCTVCHEEIDHAKAMPSPHILGLYPPRCALCHPGGLPHRAPHLENSTVRCLTCHK